MRGERTGGWKEDNEKEENMNTITKTVTKALHFPLEVLIDIRRICNKLPVMFKIAT